MRARRFVAAGCVTWVTTVQDWSIMPSQPGEPEMFAINAGCMSASDGGAVGQLGLDGILATHPGLGHQGSMGSMSVGRLLSGDMMAV
jgi:hypothetical protein